MKGYNAKRKHAEKEEECDGLKEGERERERERKVIRRNFNKCCQQRRKGE